MFWILGVIVYLIIGVIIPFKLTYSLPLLPRILLAISWFPLLLWTSFKEVINRF
jgi:hypothetical protein